MRARFRRYVKDLIPVSRRQGSLTQEKEVERLVEAVSRREVVSVTLVHYSKAGKPLCDQLQVEPVDIGPLREPMFVSTTVAPLLDLSDSAKPALSLPIEAHDQYSMPSPSENEEIATESPADGHIARQPNFLRARRLWKKYGCKRMKKESGSLCRCM